MRACCVCLRGRECVRLCLTMVSTRLAAGISQCRDRTCCLSGRRVAIVTLSASPRCFWETIPHPNWPVWVSATGLTPPHPPSHPSFPAACLSVFSLPFLCFFVLFCSPLLSPALFEHSSSAQAVVVRLALIHEVRGRGGTTKIGTFLVSGV